MSKILNPTRWWDRLFVSSRIRWGLCPRCNSDAPAIDDCWVCNEGRLVGINDRNILRSRWWKWEQKIRKFE